MERYKKERKGSQEMEEYLKTLLENEVKPLWPKGWMQSRCVTLVHTHTFSCKARFFILLKKDLFVYANMPLLNVLFQVADKGEQENVEPLCIITVSTMKS